MLKDFIKNCLGPTDNILQVQFNQKSNRQNIPVLMTIEVEEKANVERILERLNKTNVTYQVVNKNKEYFDLLI